MVRTNESQTEYALTAGSRCRHQRPSLGAAGASKAAKQKRPEHAPHRLCAHYLVACLFADTRRTRALRAALVKVLCLVEIKLFVRGAPQGAGEVTEGFAGRNIPRIALIVRIGAGNYEMKE